jgi:hypothetical protein
MTFFGGSWIPEGCFQFTCELAMHMCLNEPPSCFHLLACANTVQMFKWITFMFSFSVLAIYLCCILVLYHVCVSLTCVVAVYMCVHLCCRFASTVALIQRRFVFCRLRHLCYWATMSTLAHLVNLLLHKNLHNCFLNKRKLVHVFGFEPFFLATRFWCFLLFFDFLLCLGISVFQGLTIKVYFHFLVWLLTYGCRVYV